MANFTLPQTASLLTTVKRIIRLPKLLLVLIVACCCIDSAKAAIEPIPSGSFIINMGVLPQTYGNGVKPWGMVFDLIRNHHVQVKWVINSAKVRFGKDFTYNGVDYKGGTFIILQEYRNAAVNARISYWQSKGVVGITTNSTFNVDVTHTLKYTPRWTFDFQNGKIALGFLLSAGIDTAGFPKKYPADLNGCDDLFVMPHADPTWATHKNLLTWNQNSKGWIWAGCHAVSVLENLCNPANTSQKMNFLSQTGLVLWNNHSAASAPFNYRFPADPEMQFMGNVENAMKNGSEQVFLPLLNGGWRPTTKLGVYDPTQQDIPVKSPGEAALVAYGYAFGDPQRGKVMYEAAHNIDKDNEDAVSALRAFFNFSFMAVLNKQTINPLNGQASITTPGYFDYTVNLPAGYNTADYSFSWTTDCAGSFSNPTGVSTIFQPNPGFSGDCQITVTITDNCGRQYYQSIGIPAFGRNVPVDTVLVADTTVRVPAGEEPVADTTVDAVAGAEPVANTAFGAIVGAFVNGYGQLNWNTLSEGNLDHFEIERGRDADNFENIGKVNAHGNSHLPLDYSYPDLLAKPGAYLYRLKIVDKDDKYTYSKVVVINSESKGISLLLVYPNPFGHKVQVKVESEKREEVTIRVLNNMGGVIRSQTTFVEKGVTAIEVKNVADLPAGAYHLQIVTPEKSMSVKIMKQ